MHRIVLAACAFAALAGAASAAPPADAPDQDFSPLTVIADAVSAHPGFWTRSPAGDSVTNERSGLSCTALAGDYVLTKLLVGPDGRHACNYAPTDSATGRFAIDVEPLSAGTVADVAAKAQATFKARGATITQALKPQTRIGCAGQRFAATLTDPNHPGDGMTTTAVSFFAHGPWVFIVAGSQFGLTSADAQVKLGKLEASADALLAASVSCTK